MRSYVPLLARILLGLIFVMSGITKITGFEGTQQYMASHGIPLTAVFLVGAIAVEILGGLSVILGLWPRAGAAVLVLFLIPATLIFHTDFSQQTQMIMFLKNLSIMGGLLLVMAFGGGRYRIRALGSADDEVAYA
jgi:putative oxidoreductase